MANHPRRSAKTPKTLDAWWFAAGDTLPHGDGRKIILGEKLTVDPPIIPCERGLHASVDPFDALQYAPGPMLYKVVLSGEIVAHETDKHAASERTVIAVRDATPTLREFARKMALSVIHLWDAPAVVREYLETGNESKRDAAWAAAWAASGDAARAAAGAAAWAAAGAAAWAAARAAAGDASGDAARAASGDAARAAAKTLFREMVAALFADTQP
jgi:hypothetical protein